MSADLTPFNPCPAATKRVTDAFEIPTCCRYCQGQVTIVHHTAIYFGKVFSDWPWVYKCGSCTARIGLHDKTNLPLGTLADDALRSVRNACKPVFEHIWKTGLLDRNGAYRWLAKQLGKPIELCHFGLFEADDCLRAKAASEAFIANKPSTMAMAFKNTKRKSHALELEPMPAYSITIRPQGAQMALLF